MKRVGILVGREVTFPESIINSINEKGNGEIVAEMVKIGGIRLDEPLKYDVIIDRISHEIPYYRATLKRMALEGTYVINNPFWWSADDKFFNFSLAAKISGTRLRNGHPKRRPTRICSCSLMVNCPG